ncbi:nuclear fragile X mental retardation-interacting protein 1-like [Varroa destructor]|uniref:C2H2-type domain-containing protein n=1 Tax=Varroa destructor TaxID=109461 RepID=A0A7M7MD58_VARDE|nr:nuclear fragile X mental retardation-interacting protein 1-like [Varroa destructor]
MALFNPFRENVSVPQMPVPTVPTSVSPKGASPNFPEGGFRGRGAGRFSQGRPRRGKGLPWGFRGCAGKRGRSERFTETYRNSSETTLESDEVSLEFQCEACERVFFSQEDLKEHFNLHVSCPYCKYAALQQLVDLHVKLIHDKHLASKVMEQSPEEIAEYLAERRRKFPRRKVESERPQDETSISTDCTAAQEKKGVIHQDNVRGNKRGKFGHTIIKDCKDRNDETNGFSQGRRSRNRKRNRGRQMRKKKFQQPVVPLEDKEPQIVGGVQRFKGLGLTSMAAPKNTDDEPTAAGQGNISDVDDYLPTTPTQRPFAASRALASLMVCYADSDDEDVSKAPVIKVARFEDQSVPQNRNNQVKTHLRSNNSNPNPCLQQLESLKVSDLQLKEESVTKGSMPIMAPSVPRKPTQNDSPVDPEVRAVLGSLVDKLASAGSKKRVPPVVQISNRKLSLLEKLLAKDIRHERNILLQCVDFVVQKKFFDGMNYDV